MVWLFFGFVKVTGVASTLRRFRCIDGHTPVSFGRARAGRAWGAPAQARGEDSLLLARGTPSGRCVVPHGRRRRGDGDVVEGELDHPPDVDEEVVGDERYGTARRPELRGSLGERDVRRGRSYRVGAGWGVAPVEVRLHGRVVAHDACRSRLESGALPPRSLLSKSLLSSLGPSQNSWSRDGTFGSESDGTGSLGAHGCGDPPAPKWRTMTGVTARRGGSHPSRRTWR